MKEIKLKLSFQRIKEDINYIYNELIEMKKSYQLWLNNLINNQNIQSEKTKILENKVNKLEQQMNLIIQLLQKDQDKFKDDIILVKKH